MPDRRQYGVLLLLASCALAQRAAPGPVNVQSQRITRDSTNVRVEITLTGPANGSVTLAKNPERLVLDLPNALAGTKRQVDVNYKGVRRVRLALNSAFPPVTRVVVDLDQVHPYVLRSEGNRVLLMVGPAANGIASTGQGARAAGASGGLTGIFKRRPVLPAMETGDDAATGLPTPPPPGAPIKFPNEQEGTVASSGASTSSYPTAAHPDRGSLQEGTVFPGLGSPATGNVPAQKAPASTAATNSASAGGNSQSSGVTTLPGAVFPATTVASAGVPSVVATPPQQSNPEVASAGPAIVTQAQPLRPDAAPVNNKPEFLGSSHPVPVAVAPAQAKAEPVADARQAGAPTTATPPSPQLDSLQAQSIAEVQPAGQTTGSPSTEISPAELPAKAPAANEFPVVVAAEPAPAGVLQSPTVAPVAPEKNGAVSPEAATDKTPTDADLPVLALRAVDPNLRTVFKVKYVADGVAYLDGGRSSGLTEGMKLQIKDTDLPAQQGSTADPNDPRAVAELEVTAVAETSAVTDIHLPKRQVEPGDLAYLSAGDAQALVQQQSLSATRKYPAVVTFTEGDPLEEEARAEVPRPPQPSVNRARGRIGFDYMGTVSRGSTSLTSSNIGMIVRADITRINGTYWNLSGYWRGRLTSLSSTRQQTLQDLINRTYHLSMTYDNPNSAWVAGFGRLYLPWASSLDTIDGGYFGRRVAPGITTGIFAGSTPDPTSWDYNLDRRIGGAFVNIQGGSLDAFHYTSTAGLGISTLKWKIDRPFVFFENTVSYKRYLSIYHSLQADSPAGNPAVPAPGPGISRSFLTLRIQPHPRLELDVNHNYFRDVPTFDPQLIGTGLLDKYLFQGFSAGARVEVVKQIFVYGSLGQSSRSGDAKSSLNQMYGVAFNHLPWMGLRADAHYSKFNSSFGSGSYRAVSLSRNFNDDIRLEVLGGDQTFNSALTTDNRSRFVNTNLDFAVGAHYFMQGGFTVNRGQLSYDQWMFTLGYRFDSKGKHQQ